MATPHSRPRVDVAIVGLGAFGSAAACYLARRGASVCGIDRYHPPHTLGSSHGSSRIIREAYAEDPLYVPWLRRAYTLWEELEALSGRPLLARSGGLMIGPRDSELVEGARLSARSHGLACDLLEPAEVARRWPGTFSLPAGTVAVHDARAGVLAPEACIEAFLAAARQAGADLRPGTELVSWRPRSAGVELQLADGTALTARRLVLAAGPWMAQLVPALAPHLQVARQVMHWFAPSAPALAASLPIFVWEHQSPRIFYGFPDQGEGLKVAIHHDGELTTADSVERQVAAAEVREVRLLCDRYLPGLCGDWLRSAVCLYTNTPDGHFLLTRHPEQPAVLLASPCSGHGFKFAPALGEALADLALDRPPRLPLAPFSLERLTSSGAPLTRVRTGAARFSGEPRRDPDRPDRG
jgi:sarcosine oxidase